MSIATSFQKVSCEARDVEGQHPPKTIKTWNTQSENPFWSFEDSSFISSGSNEVCLVSEKGGWESLDLDYSGIAGNRLAPIIEFRQDNGSTSTWELPIADSYLNLYFNQTRGLILGKEISGIMRIIRNNFFIISP